jgi:starch phosphorylase
MAMQRVKSDNNEVLTVNVPIDHRKVAVRVWRVNVGRNPLYLLDTDFPENPPENRKITRRLYVDDRDQRLIQEIVLGIGGVAALKAMGLSPTVWHMNEGHSAFLGLERIRQTIQDGDTWENAVHKVRTSTVFTTHTPVPAGNEIFDVSQVRQFFMSFERDTDLSPDNLIQMGKFPNDQSDSFNMTIFALRLAEHTNGVSQLHGEVARKMWQPIWPDRKEEEVPIGAITNGVHTHTWMTTQIQNLFDYYLGRVWRDKIIDFVFWEGIWTIPENELWKVHQKLKIRLFEEIRNRLTAQRERNSESKEAIEQVASLFDPDTLTIGFARRFAPYKRGDLIFYDRERLKEIFSKHDFPIQLIFAGKAHPADKTGQAIIRQIYEESRSPDFNGKIVFIENYDMILSRRLVSGVDVWLNSPRRPKEASGTSGMKAAINGVLNLSVLDGWWREGYDGDNGWAIGEEKEYDSTEEQDVADARSLYDVLENQVIPLYYDREGYGYPHNWIQKMKKCMRTLIPRFNTYRMLEEYMTQMYFPALNRPKE